MNRTSLRSSVIAGLKKSYKQGRNDTGLLQFHNLKATEFGAYPVEDIEFLIPESELEENSISYEYPFPQLIRGRNVTLLATKDKIYKVNETAGLSFSTPTYDIPINPVISIREEPWYRTKRQAGGFGSASMTSYYAPLAVYADALDSSPPEEIASYEWYIDDGETEVLIGNGFSVGFVIEDEDVVYDLVLKIKNKFGTEFETSIPIMTKAYDGRTFYVAPSSEASDDNDGLSELTPWRSAQKVFSVWKAGGFQEGDRVLFKRGGTYLVTSTHEIPHYIGKYGIFFGAYGEGNKPIIRRFGLWGSSFVRFTGHDTCHITFADLEFDGYSPANNSRGRIFEWHGRNVGFLFLRCDFKTTTQALMNLGNVESESSSNFFLVECTFDDCSLGMVRLKVKRFFMSGCVLEESGDHCVNCLWLDGAVIQDNEIKKPKHAKRALRIAADTGDFDIPSRDIWVDGNLFQGMQDVDAATRYTECLVEIAPSAANSQSIENIVLTGNSFDSFENALTISACQDIVVSGNTFETDDFYPNSKRIILGKSNEQRPLDNVLFFDNVISTNELRTVGKGTVVHIDNYIGVPYRGLSLHRNLRFLENTFTMRNAISFAFRLPSGADRYIKQYKMQNTYTDVIRNFHKVILVAGVFSEGGGQYTLDEWFLFSGQEAEIAPADPSIGWQLTPITVYKVPTPTGSSLTNGGIDPPADEWRTTGTWKKDNGTLYRETESLAEQIVSHTSFPGVVDAYYLISYKAEVEKGMVRACAGDVDTGLWRGHSGEYSEIVQWKTSTNFFFQCSKDFIGSIDDVSVRLVPSVEEEIPAGGRWHFIDFHDSWILLNGKCSIWQFGKNGLAFCDKSRTVITGCEHRGRAVFAGFNPADYWSAAWLEQWQEWLKDMPAYAQGMGLDQNWAYWTSIGGGDLMWFLQPEKAIVGNINAPGHGEENPIIFEFLQRNDSGFMPLGFKGKALAVKTLGEGVVAYGEDGVSVLRRYSDPAPTFGLLHTYKIGIANRGAIGGNDVEHLFIDNTGTLWHIGPDFQAVELGYRDFFSPLVGYDMCISLDEQRREWYIVGKNSKQEVCSYLLTQSGLCSISKAPTSIYNVSGRTVGAYFDSGSRKTVLETDIFDLGDPYIKTLFLIQIVAEQPENTKFFVTLKMRIQAGGEWFTIGPKATDRTNRVVFYVTGVEFKVIVEAENYEGIKIKDIEILHTPIGKLDLSSIIG